MTIAQQIARGARARGLDPRAVLAVASTEGLGATRPGDQGTSFGPFQLHMGGALPRAHYGDAQRWASSPQGITYALNEIARAARGLHGHSAIAAIVSRFERPLHPGQKIAKAAARYGQIGGGPVGATASPGAPSAAPPPSGVSAAPDPRLALLQAFQPGPQHGDFTNLYAALEQQRQQPTSRPAATVTSLLANTPQKTGALGTVTLAHGADRAGVRTSPVVLRFVRRIAGLAGEPLTIGTGTEHSRMTVPDRSGHRNVSDHWSGHAADIPATGRELIRLGRLALIAAGMSRGQAMKQTGGLFNVGGHQIIFNTQIGGDHTNHLHVSAY